MAHRRRFSLRDLVTSDTITGMRSGGYGWGDVPAIRTISNDIIDHAIRNGYVTSKEADRLSQDVTIQEVQRSLRRTNWRR